MKQNVCALDRRLRIALGLALLGFALSHEDGKGDVPLTSVLAGYAAAELFLINGLLQWCPVNDALGIDTCERDWPARIRGVSEESVETSSPIAETGLAELIVRPNCTS